MRAVKDHRRTGRASLRRGENAVTFGWANGKGRREDREVLRADVRVVGKAGSVFMTNVEKITDDVPDIRAALRACREGVRT